MGIKETIINNMKKISNKNREISEAKFEDVIEKAIENMYQKGISLSNANPIESLKRELELMVKFNSSDIENVEIYKKALRKVKNLDYNEKRKIEDKLSNSLEFEEYEQKDGER